MNINKKQKLTVAKFFLNRNKKISQQVGLVAKKFRNQVNLILQQNVMVQK